MMKQALAGLAFIFAAGCDGPNGPSPVTIEKPEWASGIAIQRVHKNGCGIRTPEGLELFIGSKNEAPLTLESGIEVSSTGNTCVLHKRAAKEICVWGQEGFVGCNGPDPNFKP